MKKKATALLAGIAIAAIIAALAAGATSPVTAARAPGTQKTIVQTAVAAGQFKTLVALVKQAGLVKALSGPGQLTVFAPTDAAFAKVPKKTLAALGKNKAQLKAVLLYHVVKGKVTAAQAGMLTSATTLEGAALPIRTSGGKVFVGGAQVLKADVMASNGVIHVINKVLLPPKR
jgi:uncharacterized surface protein with fasciclin (FAS1) repeats